MNLKDKLTLEGKTTIGTGVILFGGMEGLMHMGSTGLYLAGAGTLLAFLHGEKVARASSYVKDKIVVGGTPRIASQGTHHVTKGKGDEQQVDLTILLGHDRKGKEVRRLLSDLKSILILGAPGGGKSSTASWIVSQIIERGGRIAIIDRHARSDESLSAMLSPFEAAFLQAPASTPQDAMDTIQFADDILQSRIDGTQPCDTPFLLVIDEMSDIMRQLGQKSQWGQVAQSMAGCVEQFNTGGRKYNCFTLCIGQISNASRTGGTEIRDLFNTRLIHGMKESQSRIILPKEFARTVSNLATGECVVDMEGKEDPFQIKVPQLTAEHSHQIACAIKRDPLEELAEMDDIDPDDSRYQDDDNSSQNFSPRSQFFASEKVVFSNEKASLSPIIPDKGPRAEDIDIDILIAVWNSGFNSVGKLMKVFKFTNHQAQVARKRILEHADTHIAESID